MFKKLLHPVEGARWWTRFLIFQARIWWHCRNLMRVNRCGTQAAALSYYTVFGIVPITIVMLLIFQMFPAYADMGQEVRELIYSNFQLHEIKYGDGEEQVSITSKLDELADQYLTKLNTGAIGIVSALLTIYAAIRLLGTIEGAFNMIYRVPSGRRFLARMVNYWSLLTLGPILLGLGIHFTTRLMMMKGLHEGIIPYVQPILPFFISILLFFFMYFTLPNTSVRASSAMYGAVVAGILWTLAKWAFGLYVTKFVPFNAVWGILGIIPLTVFWIYWTWIFILFGLQLSYATQHLKTLDAAELARARQSTDELFVANDQTVTRIMEFVLRVFEQKDEQPVTAEMVSNHLSIPVEFAEKVLDHMVHANLICLTNEPVMGYVPATDGSHISLADISRAVDEVSFAQSDAVDSPRLVSVFREIRQQLANYTLKDVLEPFHKEQLEQPGDGDTNRTE